MWFHLLLTFPGFDHHEIPLSTLGCDQILGARIFIRSTSGCNAFQRFTIQNINIWCFYMTIYIYISYPMLLLNYVILLGGMTYYLILYILFDNHLIRLRQCLGKWTTSLVRMWCGTSWNGYKMIEILGHLTVSLWTQHPVFQKNIFYDVRHGKVFPAAWLNSLWQSHPAISSGRGNSSRMCLIFWLVPWWFIQDWNIHSHMRTMVLEYESQHLPEQNHPVL